MATAADIRAPEMPPINTEILGSGGETLVLLHGWGRSLGALRPLGDLLAADYRVVLVDLPGFGRSPLPFSASNEGGGWSTLEYTERVKSLLDSLSITECVVLGHSFGGRIASRLAARYPKLVKGLILVGSHGLKRKRSFKDEVRVRWIKFLSASAKKIDGATGSRLFSHYFSPKFGSRDYKAAGELRKTLVKTVNEDLSDEVATIRCPTLLVWGANDQETPLDLAINFQRLIPNSLLHVLPNKGHEPFADVGSHLVAKYILNFLHQRRARA
jgi:pimeloyl-ACP methyl ester carboxylesterase